MPARSCLGHFLFFCEIWAQTGCRACAECAESLAAKFLVFIFNSVKQNFDRDAIRTIVLVKIKGPPKLNNFA